MSGRELNYIKRPWMAVVGMMLLIFMIDLDFTALNVGIVAISEELKMDLNHSQWILSAYLVAMASLFVFAGKLSYVYGNRRMIAFGITLFLLASMICSLSLTGGHLILGRILKGVGAAFTIPAFHSVIADSFPKNKIGMVSGAITFGAGLGLMLGPVFAGFMIANWGWRWIFWVNIPLCAFCMASILASIGPDKGKGSRDELDVGGNILLVAVLSSLAYTLNQVEVWLVEEPLKLQLVLAITVFLFIIFIRHNRKTQLIPTRLMKNRGYMGMLAGWAALALGFSTFFVINSLYLQHIKHYDPTVIGVVFLVNSLMFAAFGPVGGRMADKLPVWIPCFFGVFLIGAFRYFNAVLDENSSMLYITVILSIGGLGAAIAVPASSATIVKVVQRKDVSTAAGIFSSLAKFGNAIGIIISTSILVGVGKPILLKEIATKSAHLNLSEEHKEAAVKMISSAHRDMVPLADLAPAVREQLIKIVDTAFLEGMYWAMVINIFIMFLGAWGVFKYLRGAVPDEE